MLSSREDVIGKAQLTDPSQSLKERRVDDLLFPFSDRDESVQDIVDDPGVFGVFARAFIRWQWVQEF
jgi:hypothetical protein